jgi:peptidyl-tRNA hydrolase
MRKGKLAAQAAHASMKVFFDRMTYAGKNGRGLEEYILTVSDEMKAWVDGAFTKIVVYVNSEEELDDLATLASHYGLPWALIEDNGYTEFRGVHTITALAVGPADADAVDVVTGHLPLI